MRAWRIVKMRHQKTAFDGEGARVYGGRYSVRGQRAIYAAEYQSLAALEILVHTGVEERQLRYVKFEIHIAEADVHTVSLAELPERWAGEPPASELQHWGSQRLARYGVLRVPSVIILDEFNIVIASEHAAFARIGIGKPQPFHWAPGLRSSVG